jgi:hypothetical protein
MRPAGLGDWPMNGRRFKTLRNNVLPPIIICPAGLERYFAEMVTLIPAEGPPDFEKLAALQERYQNPRVHPEWVGELAAKYDLKVAGGRSREQDR